MLTDISCRAILTVAILVVTSACTDGQLVSYSLNNNGGQATAVLELGQPDYNSLLANNGGLSASSLSGPRSVTSDGTRLFVADTSNNRVLIWNTLPTSLRQPADLVLGQSNMTSGTANAPGVAANGLNGPAGVYATSSQLFVSDTGNHRVLVYNYPYSTYMSAAIELGQSGFSSNSALAVSATSITSPGFLTTDGTYLYVSDPTWNRVTAYTLAGLTSDQSAAFVLGQGSTTSTGSGLSSTNLNSPQGLFFTSGQLFTADQANNRVLAYNVNATTGEAASIALGQSSFTSNSSGTSSTNVSWPQGVFGDLNHLMVVDSFNNRVIEFNPGYSFGMAASYVYGQPNLNSDYVMGPTNQSLANPVAVFGVNGYVYVADLGNNRVVVFPER